MNNQDDLHDDLDPRLQRLYQQLPKEQPSAELDAKILAAANAAKNTSRRWQTPLALAASVVMVSSLVLYLRQENSSVFEQVVSVRQPTAQSAPEMPKYESTPADIAQPTVSNTPVTRLADNKASVHRQKNTVAPQESSMASADALSAQSEKKIAIANDVEQLSKAKAAASSEQESRLANAVTVATAVPAPQSQPHADVAEPNDMTSAGGQSATAEVDKLAKPSSASAEARAPMAAAPMTSTGSLAGLAMPAAKQRTKRDAASTKINADDISAPVLAIEGVAMGMSREQLVAQGLTCYVDVCHLDVNQPQQLSYWGIPSANAHLTAFLSRNVVTQLVLQQKNVSVESVKASLLTVGQESQQSCREEQGALLMARQLGANLFNLRSTGMGLSLAICSFSEIAK